MTELLTELLNFVITLWKGLLYYIPGIGRPDRVVDFLGGHLLITAATMGLAIVIGVSLGIMITRVRWLYNPVISTAGMIYTVPSLAMFGIMIPIVGIGFQPAIIALTLYSLLAIIRNTAVGIDTIDASILEAARGMGMTSNQILSRIEIPLALPIIFGGIRIAVVSTISLATLASFFGANSLGNLIFEGIAAGGLRNDKIAAGAIGASLLAILFDQALKYVELRLRSWQTDAVTEEVVDA